MRHRRRLGRQVPPRSLVELCEGERGILERIDLPAVASRKLMELGFIPGATVKAVYSAPGGDPRVFRVDGSEIALRGETAARLILRAPAAPGA